MHTICLQLVTFRSPIWHYLCIDNFFEAAKRSSITFPLLCCIWPTILTLVLGGAYTSPDHILCVVILSQKLKHRTLSTNGGSSKTGLSRHAGHGIGDRDKILGPVLEKVCRPERTYLFCILAVLQAAARHSARSLVRPR